MPNQAANTSSATNTCEPVGSGPYIVLSGDCMHSIAFEHGFFWKTLWDHGSNSEIKQARRTPGQLLPGDRVFIPEMTPGSADCATEQRHRFRRKGVPAQFILQVMEFADDEERAATPAATDPPSGDEVSAEEGEEPETRQRRPAANKRYICEINGALVTGSTDGDGKLKLSIPPATRSANLRLEPGTPRERLIRLALGGLDPADSPSGALQRLKNLGYLPGDGANPQRLRVAIETFQTDNNLSLTGTLDQSTVDKLKEVHKS